MSALPPPLRAFTDNLIWLLPADGGHLIVDPGDAAPVLAAADAGMRPVGVLLTHHHADHIGGVAALRARWPQLPVFAPEDARIPFATTRLQDGDRIAIAGIDFETLAIPGHTRSHIALHAPAAAGHPGRQTGVLFCGDTLFWLGCGRLFEGTPAQMLSSLDRLAALPDSTAVCCGHDYTLANARFALQVEPDNAQLRARHARAVEDAASGRLGPPSRIDQERAANPFLRVREPAVRAAIAQHMGHAPVDDVEAFAGLRRWKDGFSA